MLRDKLRKKITMRAKRWMCDNISETLGLLEQQLRSFNVHLVEASVKLESSQAHHDHT